MARTVNNNFFSCQNIKLHWPSPANSYILPEYTVLSFHDLSIWVVAKKIFCVTFFNVRVIRTNSYAILRSSRIYEPPRYKYPVDIRACKHYWNSKSLTDTIRLKMRNTVERNDIYKICLLIFTVVFAIGIMGEGILLDPLNRSSLWRNYTDAPYNFMDDDNNCGGFVVRIFIYLYKYRSLSTYELSECSYVPIIAS